MSTAEVRVSRYRWTLRLLGLGYLLGAVVMFFFSSEFIYLINVGPKILSFTLPITETVDHFWTCLGAVLMSLLAGLAFVAAQNPNIRGYLALHILEKLVAVTGFTYLLIHGERCFIYFVAVTFDAIVALLLMWLAFGLGAVYK